MGQIRTLDESGDTRQDWDPNNPAEVASARAVFELYQSRGFMAARMENDRAGDVIREFDPNAGTIILMPQMQGG